MTKLAKLYIMHIIKTWPAISCSMPHQSETLKKMLMLCVIFVEFPRPVPILHYHITHHLLFHAKSVSHPHCCFHTHMYGRVQSLSFIVKLFCSDCSILYACCAYVLALFSYSSCSFTVLCVHHFKINMDPIQLIIFAENNAIICEIETEQNRSLKSLRNL